MGRQCNVRISQIDGIDDNPIDLKSSSTGYSEGDDALSNPSGAEIDSPPEESDSDVQDDIQEEQLDSGDDIPGVQDELREILTYNDNLMVCKYKKITTKKALNGQIRYRFKLRNGIVRVNGNDYPFSSSEG